MGVRHNTGHRGRELQDHTGLTMGCSGEEQKARKDLGDLGRKKCGKTEGLRDKKGQFLTRVSKTKCQPLEWNQSSEVCVSMVTPR